MTLDDGDVEYWLRLAEDGDTAAMFRLGWSLTATDPIQAAYWYRRAAEAGDRSAMFNLWLLVKGADRRERQKWLERAADLGHTRAMYALGNLYLPWHRRKAKRWFRQVADNGDSRAMVRLAGYFDTRRRFAVGRHRERERLEMLWLLMHAAELGNSDAMCRLGWYCATHDDDEGANRWFRSAADLGHSAARIVTEEGVGRRTLPRIARAIRRETGGSLPPMPPDRG